MEQIKQAYTIKASHESEDSLKRLERHLILQSIDQHWQVLEKYGQSPRKYWASCIWSEGSSS